MNVTLVSVPAENEVWQMPYASLRLKTVLEAHAGFPLRVDILNEPLRAADEPRDFVEKYRNEIYNADVIGFSVYVWNRQAVEAIAAEIRKESSRPVLIAGGPETECRPDELSALFDLVIPGEGEERFPQAVADLQGGVPAEDIRSSFVKSAVQRPDKLPSPYIMHPDILKTFDAVLWELSRGCPYKCAFCFESKGFPGVRKFSDETALAELKLFSEYGVRQVFVLDPTFNHNDARCRKILNMIEREAPDIHFTFEVRAELLNEATVELFSRIQCSLQIGVQSTDPQVLKNIGRSMDVDRFVGNVELLNEYGVVYGFDLIYGLPGDTADGFFESFDFVMSLLPNHLDIFPLSVLPGTVLHDNAASLGLTLPPSAPYLFIPGTDFTAEDAEELARFAKTFDAFYNKGKAVSWFPLLTEFLEISPSALFRGLPEPAQNLAGDELFDYQTACIGAYLPEDVRRDEFLVMKDIIRYFSCGNDYSASGYAYDPEDLVAHLETGITDLSELAAFVRRRTEH